MDDNFKGSPYRRHTDEEAGCSKLGCDSDDEGTFSIPRTKDAPIVRLKRWRQAALVLNASRRFRYTLDLKKEEEKLQTLRKIRAHAQAIRAAVLFKEAGEQANVPSGDFAIGQEQLSIMTRDHNNNALQQFGGVKGLSDMLKTNLEKGIPADDVDLLKRRSAFGSNTYPRKKGRSFWMFLWEAWQDLTLIILMIAAAASLALGIKTEGIKEGWYDGGSIAFAVILVIVVTAVSDYRQSLQFQNLNEEKRNIHLEVIRGGRRVEVSIYDLVVGDVVPLNIGDQVPADGVLISGHSLSIDESSMTGESKIVHKDSKDPFLMSGCKVADGNGTMLVTSVGINTEWGLLMASISEDSGEETPLQVRLNGVATFIGIVGLTVALIVLVVLLARFFTGHTKNAYGTIQFKAGKTKVSDAVDGAIKILTVAVTIVVVAVPEGLPLAVTLTLAYSMRKMMADKALVRRLSACETMGSATTICSDKTGTLTLNQMTVVEAYVGGRKMNPTDSNSQLSPMVTSLLVEGIAQNTTGSVYLPPNGGEAEVSGSPTEKAILQWGMKLGMNFEAVRSECSVLHVFPFNSLKKRGGVAVQLPNSEVHIHWKGAAEIVLDSCTGYIDTDDRLVQMDEDKLLTFKKAIEDMASSSLRCVAIAYRTYERERIPDEEELSRWALPEDDLVLLAIVGIKDPCRPSVKDAIRLCRIAGVKVRMLTGDNIQTARAIALECGILTSEADATEPNIIEGKSFRALSETQREEIAGKISVMGRSSPSDKLLLVQALRKRGDVVAVTGDGTNDAPALHEADIGLAMGIQGTEVAKESSDIIILDDNFASVVKVVRWGRSVYANIQKFIQFQLTVNVAALVINFVAAVSSGDVPLNAVQLLWVNLIMDTLGALALATEPPTDHLMQRSPVGRREPLITNIMWRNLLIQASYQVSVLLVLNFQGKRILNLESDSNAHSNKVKNTLIFNSFVLCQIFNEFNARKPDEKNIFKGITKNRLFMGIVAVTLVLQILIIQFLGKFASTTRLNWKHWIISVVIGFISWPLAILGKLIPVPATPFSNIFNIFKRRRSQQRN
ncbi:calcium-transporting ATPase 8 plasma membrane-type [Citrus sinensis]|uniref:Calcium-transporting ATPase 8 plasma membrane-type n=1 Tax=Citrus sinensis TaxID=2711 RepID=A0ACB8P676_CITSI|nr:calcium-transporting ATPase 8 plasma membrane-type [Citrus sinensis]